MSKILSALDEKDGQAPASSVFSRSGAAAAKPKSRFQPRSGAFPKSLSVMGSTGSIGLSTLRLVRGHPDKFVIKALAARRNTDLLIKQALEFKPELVCVFDEDKALETQRVLRKHRIRVVTGIEGLNTAASLNGVDEVLFAMVGAVGLIPIFTALRARKAVAIANKEPLVMAGQLLMQEAKKLGVPVFPVDSEHSGLWQCLEGRAPESVQRLILTSSGGPFRTRRGSLAGVTPAQALKHPKWKMGPKITIDSATLMNKGLEVIEAANLFDVPADKIEVLIHPEAIIHAMVEFIDGSHLAQLGVTDMLLPIQYALSYPERITNSLERLDFAAHKAFHFEKPDLKRFPCLALGYESSRAGGSMPAVLNAANEIVVEAFLQKKIGFLDIPAKLHKVMKKHRVIHHPGLEDLLEADLWARKQAEAVL